MTTCDTRLPDTAPEDFASLCAIHMPRAIHDKVDFENTLRVVDWIAVRAHLTDQFDYAETLGELVSAYEHTNDMTVNFKLTGLNLLKEIVKQSSATQAKLASILGVEQGTVSKIMTGDRALTVLHAKRLASHFHVRAADLLGV